MLADGDDTIPMIMDDGDALLDHVDRDPAASQGKIATLGYCMSATNAINFATRYPDSVGRPSRSTASNWFCGGGDARVTRRRLKTAEGVQGRAADPSSVTHMPAESLRFGRQIVM